MRGQLILGVVLALSLTGWCCLDPSIEWKPMRGLIVLLVSTGRSGSSLSSQILGQHSRVLSIFEPLRYISVTLKSMGLAHESSPLADETLANFIIGNATQKFKSYFLADSTRWRDYSNGSRFVSRKDLQTYGDAACAHITQKYMDAFQNASLVKVLKVVRLHDAAYFVRMLEKSPKSSNIELRIALLSRDIRSVLFSRQVAWNSIREAVDWGKKPSEAAVEAIQREHARLCSYMQKMVSQVCTLQYRGRQVQWAGILYEDLVANMTEVTQELMRSLLDVETETRVEKFLELARGICDRSYWKSEADSLCVSGVYSTFRDHSKFRPNRWQDSEWGLAMQHLVCPLPGWQSLLFM